MVHKCAVGGCPNRSDTIIHYILPEDPKRRSVWMKFMEDSKANGENVSSSCRVCGDHFSEESYFKLNVGYTTCKILSVDAVPTIFTVNRSSETHNKIQNEETDDTCTITISETISLACVKEEPLEYDLNGNMTPQEEQTPSIDDSVKPEESELTISENMDIEEGVQGQDINGENKISTDIVEVRRGVKNLKCLTCGQSFPSRSTLIKHQRASHTNQSIKPEMIFDCTTCGEKFPKMRLLMQHRAIHMAGYTNKYSYKRYMCDQCGKGFAYESFLKLHQKVHEYGESILPHACHLCSRRFGYKVALIAHVKQHLRETESPCPICEKSFPSRGSLAQHIRTSHARKKLKCKTCNSSFSKVKGFIKHMDKHNVVTLYCETCKISLMKQDYAKHMLSHEQNNLPKEQALVASSADKPKRGRKKRRRVLGKQRTSDKDAVPGFKSESEPVTVTHEETGMELLSENEVNVLAESATHPSAVESAVDPSALEVVESGEAQTNVEKDLAQDNHEEEKSKDDALTQ